jgi:hypothetical protein
MSAVSLPGTEFAEALATGEAHERLAGSGSRVVLVDGDDLADSIDPPAAEGFLTLPFVVVAVVSEPDGRRPAWSDLVVAPDSPELETTVRTAADHPLAATALAVLLRSSRRRSVAEGLVAESTTYGLLQHGPEFAGWRESQPVRTRAEDSSPRVAVVREGQILSITLNRPDRLNALDAAMRDGLLEALQVAVVDPTVTSVVVRGEGRAFCSGGDLDEFGSRPDPVTAHLVRLQRNLGRTLAEVADRTTVHIHGPTAGSGIELAAFARWVVAARSTRISLPEVRLGLIPGAGGTVSLPRRIGRHAAMLLALGLPSIDADVAKRWGLVDEIEA